MKKTKRVRVLTPEEQARLDAIVRERAMDIVEAAAYLRLSKGTVYNLVHQGRLRCGRAGNRLRFRTEDLDRFQWGRERKTHAPTP